MSKKFLSPVALTGITSGSILKVNSSGEIVAAVDGTDYNTGSSQWTTTGNDIYYTTGNVGIGTNSPTNHLLHLAKSGSAPTIKIERTDTSDIMLIAEGSSYGYIQNTTGPLTLGGSGGNQQVYISTGGLVGIGTTSPSQPLHVYKTSGHHYGLFENTIYETGVRLKNSQADWTIFVDDSSNNNNPANGIGFWDNTANANRLVIDGSGNVGIGETSPDGLLHIKGSAQATEFYIESSTGTASTSGAIKIAQNNRSAEDFAGEMVFYVQDNNVGGTYWREAMAIINNGNVGIGNSSPGNNRLKVTGATEITGNLTLSGLGAGFLKTDANGAVSVDTNTYLTSYTESDTLDSVTDRGNTTTNNITVNSVLANGTVTSANSYLIIDSTDNDRAVMLLDETDNLVLQTGTASGSRGIIFKAEGAELMRIAHTGNVGIGTTSPSAKLQLSNGNNSNVQLLVGEGSTYGAPSIRFVTASTNYMGLGFTTGSVVGNEVLDAIAIQRTGNVGIGTASPSSKLHIYTATGRSFQVDQSTANVTILKNDYELELRSGGGYDLKLNALGSSTFGAVTLRTNGSEVMRAASNGNVGINTTNPTSKLHVYNGEAIIATSTDGIKLSYSVGNSSGIIDTAFSDNNLEFRTNGSTKMWIANGGNVGIGTTSPTTKLNVPDGEISTEVFSFSAINGITPYNSVYIAAPRNGNLGLFTASTERITIDASGNVGINTTAPEDKLHVLVTSTTAAQGIYLDSGSGNAGSAFLNLSTTDGPVLTGNTNTDGNVRGAYKASRIVFNGLGFKFQHSSETTGARTWSSHMVIDTDGKVGIGVGTPSTLLHVNGTITAPGIKTENAATVLDNSGLQPDQGSTEKTVVFKWSGSEIASLNNEGYFTASGYKTSGTTGYLKSDGTVDTSTFITSIPSEYVTDTELTTALNSYITVSSFNSATVFVLNGTDVGMGDDVTLGTAAFSASTDFVAVSGDTMTGDLQLGGNQLLFNTGNVAAPSTTDQHAGTRILLYPNNNGAHYAIGIEGNTMWFNSDVQYKWYVDASNKMTLDGSGNLTIAGTFTDSTGTLGSASYKDVDYFAAASHTHAASDITSGTLSNARLPEFLDNKFPYMNTSEGAYTPMVKGGLYSTTAGTVTGRLRIKLPSYSTNMMIMFRVDVYEYDSNRSSSYLVGGYNYSGDNNWRNTFAIALHDTDNRNLPIRFGFDTTNQFQCVSIGDTNTSWSYPQVLVRDAFGGYSTSVSDLTGTWNISFITSDTATYDYTHTGNNQPMTAWDRVSGTPTTISGYGITDGATTSYVDTAISNLVDSAPTALNTLNELAAALGDDANFSTTVTTALGNRLRVDANQGLTTDQQSTGRSNLGLGTASTSNSGDFATSSHTHDWTQITSGDRTNYTLGFRAPTSGYAGFNFKGTDGNNAGYFLIRGTSDYDVYTAEGITLVADQGWLTLAQRYGTTNGIRFMTGSTASTRMVIANGGNVGIGTTSPTTKLEVAGEAKVSSLLISDSASGLLKGHGDPYHGIMFRGVPSSATGYGITAGDQISFYEYGGEFRFYKKNPTTLTEIARIEAANISLKGYSVISSPNNGNDIYANIRVIRNLHETDGMYIGYDNGGSTAAHLRFYANGTNERMRIDASNGNVGIGTDSPKTKVDINGTIGFGSKSVSLSDTFADVLTVNMNAHTGCYVKITAFGDWSSHSSIAYLGEFFLQNGANSYNEPGVIIRQVDNTASDDVQAQIVDIDGTGAKNLVIQLKTTSSSGTPATAYIQYEVRGQYNSVS